MSPSRVGANWFLPLSSDEHWGAAGQHCAWDAYLVSDTPAASVVGVFAYCRTSSRLSRCTPPLTG